MVTESQDAAFAQAVASEIRAEMVRQGKRGIEVADEMDVAQMTFSRRLTGKVVFDLIELGKVCGILGVLPEDVLANARRAVERRSA